MKYPKDHWDAMANQIHSILGAVNVYGKAKHDKQKVKQILMWDNITDDDRAYLYNQFGYKKYLIYGYIFNWGQNLDLFGWIRNEFEPSDQADIKAYWSELWKGA